MALSFPDLTSPQSNIETKGYIGPQVDWDKKGLSLTQCVQDTTFPFIACFEEWPIDNVEDPNSNCNSSKGLSAGVKIYSRQPVLFHCQTRKRQMKARSIHKDKRGRYMEIGQSLVIPEEYTGWFEVVPSDFSRSSCYLTVDELAQDMPKQFFTRSHVRALRIEGEGEEQKFIERKISPGSVLETKGRFRAKIRHKAQTGLFKKKTKEYEMNEVCYLKCTDPKDQQEIMIPFEHKGKFNAVHEKGKVFKNVVYTISDIMKEIPLPARVRLLFGKAPVIPCLFTGMLVLKSLNPNYEAVIGSTILNSRNVLFEIPMDAGVKVNVSANDDAFQDNPNYKDAKKLCDKYSKLYDAMIKLAPDLDTDEKLVLHMASDHSLTEQTEEALHALDLVTDINLSSEPSDHFFSSSDSGSVKSEDRSLNASEGVLTNMEEIKNSQSQTNA